MGHTLNPSARNPHPTVDGVDLISVSTLRVLVIYFVVYETLVFGSVTPGVPKPIERGRGDPQSYNSSKGTREQGVLPVTQEGTAFHLPHPDSG